MKDTLPQIYSQKQRLAELLKKPLGHHVIKYFILNFKS